ncbi:nuclear transport factor 2 family protein [Amycolatopsis sp. K13G38]|uniref:Nuclear transport factor 2 family protein n=1 Tax=Amycolatopsis acididurans TaxID=2724524 RepID=A0ABX1JEC5_9PSEU|nr:nuclear transport factor 2 family protein [Amycolatopsis acididurans]NKQ57219.1 nuclear transport factor 2 family protein [Amycolatopsis acididurans]
MISTEVDWIEICQTRYRLAAAIDGRDWDLARAVVDTQVELDYSSYASERVPGRVPAEEWIAYLATLFPGFDATQHSLSNPVVELAGDAAGSTMAMTAEHLLDGCRFTIGGRYEDAYRRRDGRWRLTATRLVVRWVHGDAAIMPLALERGVALRGEAARPLAPGVEADV